jgi:uncharacterized membrane protein YtjA (UPF0391 family)
MLRLALVFVVLTLISGVLGFTPVAGEPMYAARILFCVFVVISLAALAASIATGKRLPSR